MPDQPPDPPQPAPPPPPPGDSDVYGGQWGPGDKPKTPAPPPRDRPDKITPPAEKN